MYVKTRIFGDDRKDPIRMISQRQLFLQYLAQTSPAPLALEIVQADGLYLFDKDGRRYIDLISGISANSLGHRHPAVVAAIRAQTEQYLHVMVYGEYIQSPQVQLAKLLAEHLPAPLQTTYLVNSGSEAIEGAIKLAKRYTGRREIISLLNAYHGSTHGSLSVMGNEQFKQAYRPLLPGVRHIALNALDELEQINRHTACVVIEPVMGEAGVRIPERTYMQALREKCTREGALLICDEIQSGMGRTGQLWGFEHFDIIPDIITLAKGLGGGMPIGAFISSASIMHTLTHKPVLGHITTFGGHPVCSAAALATLQTILQEQLHEQALWKEQLFIDLLQHRAIREIRSKGLLMAVDFGDALLNSQVIQSCLKNGVITDWFLFAPECLRIAPPLNITEEEIKESCDRLLKSIDEALDTTT